MSFKVSCYACGQHYTAEPEHAGMEWECTTCGAEFVVPTESGQTRTAEGHAATLAALGIEVQLPAGTDPDDAETILEEIVMEIGNLKIHLADWVQAGELARMPTDTELRSVFERIVSSLVVENISPDEDDFTKWIFEAVPHLCIGP